MFRLQTLARHVTEGAAAAPQLSSVPTAAFCGKEKSPDDVVICAALRTPITKAKKGAFKDTPPEELIAVAIKAVVEKAGANPKDIEDVQVGNALQPGAGGVSSRMATFLAGLPKETALVTINRQCSSGLQAVANVAANIKAGVIDMGIGGGVEVMSMFGMADGIDLNKFSSDVIENDEALSCVIPMGLTSDNVAEKYNISREQQDTMAAASHAKAIAAQKNGLFDSEIIPTKVKVKGKEGVKEVVVSKDEGPRAGTTAASLGKLKPAFKVTGTTTAGNASQVSDGAAAVLLARRSVAQQKGLPIIGRFHSFAAVGVDPALMGIGPAFAIPVALEKAGLAVKDIDVFEINEAFASQATMSVQHCKIPMEKVNPKGGAIALGHPLGCTGARQIASILPELKRTGGKFGVCSMCIGTGMGAAGVIESEQ